MPDARLVVGPQMGEDAAVLDLGDRYLVVKTDPITFATDYIGWYAVQVNANDVASMGARPLWFLATILLPEGQASESLAETIFQQITGACRGLGVTLIGGHTEITPAVSHPVVNGVMLGEMAPQRLVRTSGAQVGDALLLTKGIAIEGTAILARELGNRDQPRSLQPRVAADILERCRQFLFDPGISVVQDAQVAQAAGRVTAMHDPTEGGFATGVWELVQASGAGCRLYGAQIPIYAETRLLCDLLQLDPLGLIASGALLLTTPAADAAAILAAWQAVGISARQVGEILPVGAGMTVEEAGGGVHPLPQFPRDELARFFDAASDG